ncbi:MAG: hypothetical protein EA383_16265 [Spirochaetaceae bacterium]|nr:MAG: hypothetical protein EA383_16265 [Spirochaetaceae bacterium]
MRLSERAQIRRVITDCIGEQQIDIVVSDTGAEPFFRHASDLRNDIAHEYETDELAELFGSTLELTPVLLSIAQAVFRYCSEKGYQSV